jgi:hypothetical protein
VRAELENGEVDGRPLMAIFIARLSDPSEAEEAVRRYRPTLQNVKAGDVLKIETFDRLGVKPDEAFGPL